MVHERTFVHAARWHDYIWFNVCCLSPMASYAWIVTVWMIIVLSQLHIHINARWGHSNLVTVPRFLILRIPYLLPAASSTSHTPLDCFRVRVFHVSCKIPAEEMMLANQVWGKFPKMPYVNVSAYTHPFLHIGCLNMALPQSPAFFFWNSSDQMDENWKAMELEWFFMILESVESYPHFERFPLEDSWWPRIFCTSERGDFTLWGDTNCYTSHLGILTSEGLMNLVRFVGEVFVTWFLWGPFLGEHFERFSERGWINEIWSLHSLPWESTWWIGHQRAMLPTRLHSRKHILQEKGSTVCSGNLFVIARNALLEIFVRVKRPLDVKHKPVSNCGFGSAQFGKRMRSNNCTASNKG